MLRLFPLSLEGKERKWFYTHQDNINYWTDLSDAFLSKFFPIGKTTALRGNIVSFQQQKTKSILEAWERFQGYKSDYPHHGMARWLLMQTNYHGLTQKSHQCLDVSAKGSFLELTIEKVEILLDKILENQSCFQDKAQHCHQTKEIPEEVNALSLPRWKICSIGLTRGPSSKKIKGLLRQYTNIIPLRVNPIAKV